MECNTNPIFIAQSISKLVEEIKSKQNNAVELKYIKEKCIISEDTVLSLTASHALILLVESGILPVSTTLSELVSSLSNTKSYVGLTTAICDLLKIDLKNQITKEGKYKCSFNLRAPQHPLICILKQNSSSWVDILSRVKFYYDDISEVVTYHANALLHPLYMYVFCNPTLEIPEVFQLKLWNYLIRVKKCQSINIIHRVLMWLQVSSNQHRIIASYFLIDIIQLQASSIDHDTKEILILWLSWLLYELIKHKQDCYDVIASLTYIIETRNELVKNSASTILTILADCLIICPSPLLNDLLVLCELVMQSNYSNKFSMILIKISLFQWLIYGCVLTAKSLQTAHEIILYIDRQNNFPTNTTKLYSNKIFNMLQSTSVYIYTTVELNVLSESLSSETIPDWLNKISTLPVFTLKNIINFLKALVLYDFSDSLISTTIELLLKVADVYKETSTQLLTLFLYKLSNSNDPKIHFALLKALPKMAVLKENLPLILNTLESIKRGLFNLKSFVTTLYFDLWNVNVKYYPYLQNMLTATCEKDKDNTSWWEFYVTKAYILKQICLKSPHLHGQEVVGHLSEVLNKCTNEDDGALASAIAMQGIKALCKSGIIDIASTWNELAPRFIRETRPLVIESFCELMGEASNFETTPFFDKVQEEIIYKLWYYATKHDDDKVFTSAYRALSEFTLEQVSLKLLDVLNSTSPDDILLMNLIQGECWIKLLLQTDVTALDALGNLLIKYTSNEISAYHSGIYKVAEGCKEPQNYNKSLQAYSIVRALGNYLKKQLQTWQSTTILQNVYLQCLRVLSQEYSKPLPPYDWCFLQELIHIPEARLYCIALASHQVQLSGTARRLMENFLEGFDNFTNNNQEVVVVYENLKYLCNSIQPITLRPFIESSLTLALKKAKDRKEEPHAKILLTYLTQTISNEKLHEANRMSLSQIVVRTTKVSDIDSSLFKILLECVVVLSVNYIDELSSPKLWKNQSISQLELSVQVRCAVALHAKTNPLMWLDDIIDVASSMSNQHDYVLYNIHKVMKYHRNSDFASKWILELIGKIQSMIANENKTTHHIQFLCDVFITAMIIFSCQDIFICANDDLIYSLENRLRIFPQSIAQLMKIEHWNAYAVQIAEWLFHMSNYQSIPEMYRISFYQSIVALRHEDFFKNSSIWMKYIGYQVIK